MFSRIREIITATQKGAVDTQISALRLLLAAVQGIAAAHILRQLDDQSALVQASSELSAVLVAVLEFARECDAQLVR